MSFVLAYSFGSIGIVLADTRLNATFHNGKNSVSDTKPIIISMENGDTTEWKSKYRKMSPVQNGYCAFAGDAITGRKVLDALIKSPYMSLTEKGLLVAAESYKVSSWLPKSKATTSQLKKSSVMVLDSVSGVIELSTIDLEGNIQNKNVNYAVYWPPEISGNTLAALNALATNVSCPQSIPQLHEFILKCLQLFQMVHKSSSTVSSTFEVGVLIPQADKVEMLYGFGDSNEIVKGGTDNVRRMFN